MLQWIRRQTAVSRRARELYGSVVAAARQPFFYEKMRVPDTPEGRFELIALHLFLALESIKPPRHTDDLTQCLIEAFVADMDDCMREMGVGDLSVPKKVRRAAAAFYERASAYRRGLAADAEPHLETSLARYVFSGNPGSGKIVTALAGYVRDAASALAARPFDACLESGELMKALAGTEVHVP